MDEALQEPVLIIKTAWGGKSLFHDFRPPSAGVYQRTAADIEKERYLEKDSGLYYRLMIEHVKHVLGDIKRVCPAYDEKQGFQIGGFVWLQGWNDMVNQDVYPIPDKGEQRAALRGLQPLDGGLHPRRAQGLECSANALRHRRDGHRRREARQVDRRRFARRWRPLPRCQSFRAMSLQSRPRRSGTRSWEPSPTNTIRSARWAIS